jgi:hypothetical protein
MNLEDYHRSTTRELISVSNKVRNLIDHHGEDGRYKEAVLKNIIRRFLPEKYLIATGFVIKQTDNRGEHQSSKQIDLIVYDNASPVLFREGDFVILTPDSVRAVIEIKTNIQNQGLQEIIQQANENGEFIFSGKVNKNQLFFNGLFGFEGYQNAFQTETIRDHIIAANEAFVNAQDYQKFKVNHISLNKDWFLKYWPDEENPHSLYNIQELSFSFFISNLIDTLANNSVRRNNFIWYATDKELNRRLQF